MEESELGLSELFKQFVRTFKNDQGDLVYFDNLRSLPVRGSRTLTVNYDDLLLFDVQLTKALDENPLDAIKVFQEAGLVMMTEQDMSYAKQAKRVNVRIRNYPRGISIRELNSGHIGKMVGLAGVIVRQSQTKTQLKAGTYRCSKCGNYNTVEQVGPSLISPKSCATCNSSGPGVFELDPTRSTFEDFQSISVQERPEDLPAGQMPQTLDFALTDDLVNTVRPGDRVLVTGLVSIRQSSSGFGKLRSRVFELSIDANQVEVEAEETAELPMSEELTERFKKDSRDPWQYKKLIGSVAPSIYGLQPIKEAVLLQLVSGNPKTFKDGVRVRGDINVLLVGDPGTAKSQLLKYIQRIAPRGLYTSGRGATAAGLTAAAIRDESGAFVLEAGALVLADKGLAAIDEFEKMREEDRIAIHEAMEQQTCSVAKGGIVATLNARTAILAAANPQFGRYDESRNFSENVNLSPVVLSRFDLYFVLRDIPSEQEDARLTDHILAQHRLAETSAESVYDANYIRMYIAHCKASTPKLTDEAMAVIRSFFLELRKASAESAIQITPRQLESIIRLSEARAKLVLRSEVTREDAEIAIALFKHSISMAGMDVETGKLDIDSLMTGKPKSSRDKMVLIMKIAEDLEKEFGSANIEEVTRRAEARGIDRNDARRIISGLMREGVFYSPDETTLKRTR